MNRIEPEVRAYAIGYYYGRAIGSDEPGLLAIAAEFGEHDRRNDHVYYWFKQGYESGVNDYGEEDTDAED